MISGFVLRPVSEHTPDFIDRDERLVIDRDERLVGKQRALARSEIGPAGRSAGLQKHLRQASPEEAIVGPAHEEYSDAVSTEPSSGARSSMSGGAVCGQAVLPEAPSEIQRHPLAYGRAIMD